MNKIFFFLAIVLFLPWNAIGQETIEEIVTPVVLKAEAGENKNVAVGRTVSFDASGSTIPTDKTITYQWDFGDGNNAEGIDSSYVYDRADTYIVTLTISDGTSESKDFLVVSVEETVMLLLTDDTIPEKDINDLVNYAQERGVLLVNIQTVKKQEADYLVAQKLAQKLLTSPDDLKQANIIILWTANNNGLNALSEWARIVKESGQGSDNNSITDNSWKQKIVINVADSKTGTARLAQNTFNLLNPKYIVLTNLDATPVVINNPQVDAVVTSLKDQGIDYQIISQHSQRSLEKITPFNFMSFLLNYLINKGVSQNTIFLILILPIVATIISFARQIVGVKAFGIYVPSIIALTFIETELKWGLFILLVILVAGTVIRLLAKKLRILYMPRMAIVLTLVALVIFCLFVASAYTNRTGLLNISIFPILMMIILSEKFVEVQIEKGNKEAIRLTIETLILAVLSFYIVSWEAFKTLILAYPEFILLTLILNILFGRFTGLRIVEYFRFRKLLKNAKPLSK
jgi:PKD repeat protein